VSIFLVSIIFLGIFGGFQLSIKVSTRTKIEIQAVYLANQKIEELRNLPYSEIETSSEIVTVNGANYTIQTLVESFDDCADGTIEGLDCDNQATNIDSAPDDYKKIKVIVSYEDRQTILSSYIASKSLETGENKGAIRINLSNSSGQPINITTGDQLAPCPNETINIINSNYFFDQCYGTDTGSRLLILDESIEADDYKIIITKDGYSREETFQSGDMYNGIEVIVPDKKNPTINEGELYPITFIIDETSDLNITTALTWNGDSFFDTFLDTNNILLSNNIEINDGDVALEEISPILYYTSGYLESIEIIPPAITEWHHLVFSDTEDIDTDISYQIYSETGIIPDVDLPGNNVGFDSSPVDLSGLNIITYPKLKVRANLSTADNSKTPILHEYQLSWKNGVATPLSYVNFNVRGNRSVGTDSLEQPIYKYSDNLTTNAYGVLNFTNLDTDNYYFSNFSRYGSSLDLVSSLPITLLAGETIETTLYLSADNSLLARVYDSETLLPLFGAQLRLTNSGLGYDQALSTNDLGEAVFIPLQVSSLYNLNIQLPDYYEQDVPISITGDNLQSFYLERYE